MAKRRDSGSELTPEDFLESRQDDSDSPNPVLDIIRNVDAARGDEDGADGDGMSGVRPATIGVMNMPGAMTFTRIPIRANSLASGKVIPTTPPFDAE